MWWTKGKVTFETVSEKKYLIKLTFNTRSPCSCDLRVIKVVLKLQSEKKEKLQCVCTKCFTREKKL